jgi:hypothetical protein
MGVLASRQLTLDGSACPPVYTSGSVLAKVSANLPVRGGRAFPKMSGGVESLYLHAKFQNPRQKFQNNPLFRSCLPPSSTRRSPLWTCSSWPWTSSSVMCLISPPWMELEPEFLVGILIHSCLFTLLCPCFIDTSRTQICFISIIHNMMKFMKGPTV